MTEIQKAFDGGYDKGWSEREIRIVDDCEKAIKKVISERYLGVEVANINIFAGHILREIGLITNDKLKTNN